MDSKEGSARMHPAIHSQAICYAKPCRYWAVHELRYAYIYHFYLRLPPCYAFLGVQIDYVPKYRAPSERTVILDGPYGT